MTEYRRPYANPLSHVGSRRRDRRSGPVPRRVFVAFVAVVLAATVGGFLTFNLYRRTSRLVGDIAEGRRIALTVTCAFGGAIAEAGRSVITGAAATPTTPDARRFEVNLEALGYPPLAVRRQLAAAGADAYVRAITARVEHDTGYSHLVIQTGPRAGSLDCRRVAAVARLPRG